MFVSRQKLESKKTLLGAQDSEEGEGTQEGEEDPSLSPLHTVYQQQLPVLRSVIEEFTAAKTLHEELSASVIQEQRKLKRRVEIYTIPTLDGRWQVRGGSDCPHHFVSN